jgi:hypothetical protein
MILGLMRALAVVLASVAVFAGAAVVLDFNRTSFTTMTSQASLYVLAPLHQRLARRRRRTPS